MPLESDKPLIFIAEDDPAVLELVRTRLLLAGYSTAHARDGVEALARIPTTRPAAVILDVNMPRLDGFGVLSGLRRSAAFAQVPVLMLTARHAPEDIRQAMHLGAKDYLAKPFEDAQLLSRVARLLRSRSARSHRPVAWI